VVLTVAASTGCELKSRLAYGGYGESSSTSAVPQAAGPAAPAPAAAPSATEDVAWAAELPEATAVTAIVQGTTDEQTLDLQNAALAVMQVYASARAGKAIAIVGASEGVPPLAAQRFEEYQRAQTPPKDVFARRLSPMAEAYFRNTDFQVQVLSRLVSPGSVAAYQQTEVFQDMANEEAQRAGADAFAKGVTMLLTSPTPPFSGSRGGGSASSSGGGSAATGGAGDDHRANCRAGCERYCPGAWGTGDQWTQSQMAHDSCLNEINSCKIGCN
jgi:hypothetical protein